MTYNRTGKAFCRDCGRDVDAYSVSDSVSSKPVVSRHFQPQHTALGPDGRQLKERLVFCVGSLAMARGLDDV